ITFSGLVSGLDTSSWVTALVSVKQEKVSSLQNQLKGFQSSKSVLNDTKNTVSALRTALQKLTDAKFGGTFDLFSKNSAKSSNEDIFTATVGANARRQNYDITVQQLATYTKATSLTSASSVADDSTSLSNLGMNEGVLTAYVNGQKNSIKIGGEDGVQTLGELKAAFADFGVNLNVDANGVVNIAAQNGTDTVHIGATTDTSNFTSLLGLERGEDGVYTSTNSIYKATTASQLVADDAGFNQKITAGTFTIGGAEFTIDEDTTLSSLISEINSNADAQAYAYWDGATGKLTITSTKEGASFINIEAGTSNFTDVMGLTTSEWDGEGNLVSSSMFTEAQELGKNAIFTINGTTMTSTSNTVTADVSRIDDVTLTLKRVSTEEDGQTTLSVTQDTSQLKEALSAFVTAYNDFVSKIDEVTSSSGGLHGESTLTSLKNTIRRYANGSNDMNGGAFKLLADIGISTGSADGTNVSTSNLDNLTLDEDKLLQALEEDPDSVRALLTGENSIFGMMEDAVKQTLESTTGYFDIKTKTIESNITRMNDKIKKQNENISAYKTRLEAKFKKMEEMIAAMQQNYSSLN
ncbi:flagellar filament capping protein FliD, partial [bacterium]|nr:flagellar filament capping protein FliD [bacterium]